MPETNPLGDVREYERVVVLAVDLSGSFLDLMAEKGKAWEMLLRVIDRYLRGNGHEKLILVQLSAAGTEPMLWDGSPVQLRKDFPDREAFRRFLLHKANPAGSRLHDSITSSLEYVATLTGTNAKTKRVLCCLSDFDDNQSSAGSEQRLIQALSAFGKQNGAVGFYFLDHHRVAGWRANLKAAGVKNYVVESQIVTSPTLPSFD